MSRDKDPECRAYLLRETDAAILVKKSPDPQAAGQEWWIPRSQIGYMRKEFMNNQTGHAATAVFFTLPEWLIEKKDCWELVP